MGDQTERIFFLAIKAGALNVYCFKIMGIIPSLVYCIVLHFSYIFQRINQIRD